MDKGAPGPLVLVAPQKSGLCHRNSAIHWFVGGWQGHVIMRFRLRRDRDADPAADAAIVTYSRLPPRSDRWADPDRREPVLEAEEVPLARGDFRVDPSHRAVPAFDNDDTPERPRRRRTGRGVAILGALAFAVGVMILAYAYGLATRLDGPAAPASASLGTPATPDATLTSGSAVVDTGDGVRRISPDSGSPAPAAGEATTTAALPPSGAVVQPSSASPPAPRERPAPATEQANAPHPSSENGLPMDGEFAAPAGGQPAIVAPVPATTTPPAPAAAAAAPKTADTPKSDAGTRRPHVEYRTASETRWGDRGCAGSAGGRGRRAGRSGATRHARRCAAAARSKCPGDRPDGAARRHRLRSGPACCCRPPIFPTCRRRTARSSERAQPPVARASSSSIIGMSLSSDPAGWLLAPAAISTFASGEKMNAVR